jgi:hypothetical protein
VPRRLFCVWAGDNPMNANRRRGLEEIERVNTGLEIVLVTPDNLGDFLVDGHPLHPA